MAPPTVENMDETQQQILTTVLRDHELKDTIFDLEFQFKELRVDLRPNYSTSHLSTWRSREERIKKLAKIQAKIQCRRLCYQLYSKLPRELRDEIYHYLISEKVVHITDMARACKRGIDTTHQFDEEYLGKDIARELVEHCYRSMQFHFGYNIVSIVPWLTQTDQNGLTRSELVKSVGLYINDEVFVDAFCGDFFADPFDMGENKEGAEAVYEQYMRDLSALRQVKKQTTVVVTLDPYCTKLYLNSGMVEERFDIIFWNRSLVNTLKLILPAIQWLKASGLDIRVHVLDDIHSTYEFTPTTENFSIDTYHKERMLVSSERSLYDWISGRFSILRLTS